MMIHQGKKQLYGSCLMKKSSMPMKITWILVFNNIPKKMVMKIILDNLHPTDIVCLWDEERVMMMSDNYCSFHIKEIQIEISIIHRTWLGRNRLQTLHIDQWPQEERRNMTKVLPNKKWLNWNMYAPINCNSIWQNIGDLQKKVLVDGWVWDLSHFTISHVIQTLLKHRSWTGNTQSVLLLSCSSLYHALFSTNISIMVKFIPSPDGKVIHHYFILELQMNMTQVFHCNLLPQKCLVKI